MISLIKSCFLIVLLVFLVKDGNARDLNKIKTLYCTIDQEGIEGSWEKGKIKLTKSNFWENPKDQTMIFDNINLAEQTARLITMEGGRNIRILPPTEGSLNFVEFLSVRGDIVLITIFVSSSQEEGVFPIVISQHLHPLNFTNDKLISIPSVFQYYGKCINKSRR